MRRSSFDMVSIGDCMLDVFVNIHEASVSCDLDQTRCLLSLPYGEKIPVESVTKMPGAGNASNVAVASVRLGLATAIVSTIGHDEDGQMILARWRQEQIATHLVTHDKTHETNYSTILNFKGERTILVYHQPYSYRLPDLPKTSWLYYSSLGKGHEKLERSLLTYLTKHPDVRMTFNPGTHQLRRGLRSLSKIVARSHVFIVNKEEAEQLLEVAPRSVPELLHALSSYGSRVVVITDGIHGAYALEGQTLWHCPIFPVKEVERTGAGDAFASTFSVALFQGKSIPDALRYGAAQAASVVQFVGPQAGLLTMTKLERVLKKFGNTHPKKL